jgi:glycosyltransferase involved in cell wall biosynthesis
MPTGPLRLAIVTPRFWPLAGEAETYLLRLADEFRTAGHSVQVATAGWLGGWPRQIVVREIPVVRLRPPPRGGFTTLRYMYALGNWLGQQAGKLDVVLVSTLRHEAYTAVGALAASGLPVIAQAERAGGGGDIAWQRTAAFGSRIARRCQQAAGFIATCRLVAEELRSAGYPESKTMTIPRGVAIPPPCGATTRDAAREALSAVNHDLAATTQQTVALAIGRFVPESGLVHLVKAWRTVAARHPQARLWIAGDGPQREFLYQLIGDLDLRQRVLLPGVFAESQELLAAADLFLQPATSGGSTLGLAEALACGLPVVASDLPEHREWIEGGETGLLVSAGDPRALGTAIGQLLDAPAQAIALGAAARARMRQSHTLEQSARQYLELFQQLARRRE